MVASVEQFSMPPWGCAPRPRLWWQPPGQSHRRTTTPRASDPHPFNGIGASHAEREVEVLLDQQNGHVAALAEDNQDLLDLQHDRGLDAPVDLSSNSHEQARALLHDHGWANAGGDERSRNTVSVAPMSPVVWAAAASRRARRARVTATVIRRAGLGHTRHDGRPKKASTRSMVTRCRALRLRIVTSTSSSNRAGVSPNSSNQRKVAVAVWRPLARRKQSAAS